ncbi:MAG TPA: 6-phosphogluconolactonase [Candidatus Binataceae bacterium]|nr:6-phosphogluconolactonase [Candidatus Binataceae bacterium]
MSEPQIQVLEDAPSTHVRAAEEIAHFASEAICTHAEFNLCLTGGTTPAATYELLATRFRLSVDWKEVQFFWGDERCVPPDDPASNFGMANRTMLEKLALRPEQIHRMRGEEPPEQGALDYEDELRRCFALAEGDRPRFDLVLLGLGANAHIASLFPGQPALHEIERLAMAVTVTAEQSHRLTLTAPVINHATRVMFMVTGAEKAAAVKEVLEGPRDSDRYPAQLVAPENGEILWLMDRAAASLLDKSH